MRLTGRFREGKSLPSPYIGKFKVSVPDSLSRKAFAIDREKPGGTNMPLPGFSQTSAYFIKDISRVTKEGDSLQELQWMMGQISSHYLWPCTSLGIFYRKYDTEAFTMVEAPFMEESPLKNIKQITASDLAIGVNNSVTENILRTGRATYIPDTKFERITQIVQLPENALELSRSGEPFAGDSLNAVEMKWDISSISKNIGPHSGCMFLMPLQLNTEKIGLFAIGYEYSYLWGNLLPMGEILRLYIMGDALKLALGNLLFPVKK